MRKKLPVILSAAVLLLQMFSPVAFAFYEDGNDPIYDDPMYAGDYAIAPFRTESDVVNDSRVTFDDFSTRALKDGETLRRGVDVSVYQGEIDWELVKASGVEFAIIRGGYRGWGDAGNLAKDSMFDTYISGAIEAGLEVGVYIYSQATTVEEAQEEAQMLLDLVEGYDVRLPLVLDFEFAANGVGRLWKAYDNGTLDKSSAAELCKAFCATVESAGYDSMVYTNPSMARYYLDVTDLGRIWLAHYTGSSESDRDTETGKFPASSYSGDYEYWQCAYNGKVDGISGNVDINFWFEPTAATDDEPAHPDDSHEHDFSQMVASAEYQKSKATCISPAVFYYSCSCGAKGTKTFTSGNAKGHTVVIDKAVAATCTMAGCTEGSHCSVCNTVIVKQNTIPQLAHTWDSGKVIRKPSSRLAGERRFTCSVCLTTKTEEIPALGICDGSQTCPSKHFRDVKNDWTHEGIDFAVANGLFNGTGEHTFEPNTTMTRAMLVTVLWRNEGSPVAEGTPFTDLNANWYKTAVAWAAANNIVNGVGNGKFDPNGTVSREQIATILYRYTAYRGMNTTARSDLSQFPDQSRLSSWASAGMQWAVAEGLVTGSNDNGTVYLQPQKGGTRAMVATIMLRYELNIRN